MASKTYLIDNNQVNDNLFKIIPRIPKRQNPILKRIYEPARLLKVSELPFYSFDTRKIKRAGIIPYTFINDKLYICLGKDIRTGDLTDFGGGRKENENIIYCAVREANEETRCAFGRLRPNEMGNYYCLYNSSMLIILIPVSSNDGDIRDVSKYNFDNMVNISEKQSKYRCYNEISDIVWLSEEEIDEIFSDIPNIRLFARVRRFIYSCLTFKQNVKDMKKILKTNFIM